MEPLNKAHISNYVVLLTEKGPSIATSVISPSDQVELGLDKLGEDADARVEIFWNSNINPFGVVTGGSVITKSSSSALLRLTCRRGMLKF